MRKIDRCLLLGELDYPQRLAQANRIYDADYLCPTLTAHASDVTPKFIVGGGYKMLYVKTNNEQGFTELNEGGVADFLYPSSKTRRGRVQNNGETCPTITAEANCLCKVETEYKIRKLTPSECWALMGFSKQDFEAASKVNSNSQLYKQAGNSIVVDVLEDIFKEFF